MCQLASGRERVEFGFRVRAGVVGDRCVAGIRRSPDECVQAYVDR